MIELTVDQKSVAQTIEHLEAVRLRIFAAVRDAMQEAMQGLAGVAVVEMGAAGIQSRTGELADNILKSPQIAENRILIMGRVTAQATMKIAGREFQGYLGTALDKGYSVPAVHCKTHEITAADGDTFWAQGHVAFRVRPRPFLRQAVDSYAPTLIEIIRARINEAIA